jgi:hypothetical protein
MTTAHIQKIFHNATMCSDSYPVYGRCTCPMAGFGISSNESLGSATTMLVNYIVKGVLVTMRVVHCWKNETMWSCDFDESGLFTVGVYAETSLETAETCSLRRVSRYTLTDHVHNRAICTALQIYGLEVKIQDDKTKWHTQILGIDSPRLTQKDKNY